jgi:hypothetical protein
VFKHPKALIDKKARAMNRSLNFIFSNLLQRLMYVACATAVVLISEDSEKAKAHRPFKLFMSLILTFHQYLTQFKGSASCPSYEIMSLAAFERLG